MRHPVRPRLETNVRHRSHGHHVAVQIAHLQVRDVFGLIAELRLGLRIDAIGASEAIEVIDIHRAQVGLQSIEHRGQRHALALGLDPVHVREQLRHAVLKRRVGGIGIQFALLPRLVQHLAGDPRQLIVAMRGAVLQEQLESARGAQALHRRRRHGEYHRILNGAEFFVERLRDGARRQILGLALIEGLQRKEQHRGIAQIDEALHRKAGESDDMIDAGRLLGQRGDLPHHFFGAIQRGRIGQLHDADQVLLVLRGNEAARHHAERCPRCRSSRQANTPSTTARIAVSRRTPWP